jgi:predicted ATP-grasp superfamily ATP-dependent carboligase
MTFANIENWPLLEHPVLVVGLDGWIDAGFVGQLAVNNLTDAPYDLVASFDMDALIDNRSRRPVLRLVNGVLDKLVWPDLRLLLSRQPDAGRSVLVRVGPEPDYHWKAWTEEVVGLGRRMGVEMVVGLGAFPAPVPHTRPIRVAATATDQELASKIGFVPAALEVPAGAQAVLEMAFGEAGIPAVGLWARVPHYAAGTSFPEAAAVLTDELSKLIGVHIDSSALHETGRVGLQEIQAMIDNSPEHLAMVRQLEEQHDAQAGVVSTEITRIPSGDELAEELEKFLRGEGRPPA